MRRDRLLCDQFLIPETSPGGDWFPKCTQICPLEQTQKKVPLINERTSGRATPPQSREQSAGAADNHKIPVAALRMRVGKTVGIGPRHAQPCVSTRDRLLRRQVLRYLGSQNQTKWRFLGNPPRLINMSHFC